MPAAGTMHHPQGGAAVSTLPKARTSNLEALEPLYAELNKAGEAPNGAMSMPGNVSMHGDPSLKNNNANNTNDDDLRAAGDAPPAGAPGPGHSHSDEASRDVEEQKTAAPKRKTMTKKKRTSKDNAPDGETPAGKRKRFTWSDDLHKQFMATIFDIGLIHAKPKSILQNMRSVPASLTTEHIKSHLQKYRANSKRTQELFQQQFEIAKRQAEQFSDGKALNPVFHAYPMPIGNYPMGDVSFLADGSSAINTEMADPVDYGGMRPGYDGNAGMRTNFMIPGSYEGPNATNGHGGAPAYQSGPGASGYQHGAGGKMHPHTMPHAQQDRQMGMHGEGASGPGGNANNNMVFEQMEVQMRIHAQIQQQHEMQQYARKSQARGEPDSTYGRAAESTANAASAEATQPPQHMAAQVRSGNVGRGPEKDAFDIDGPFPSPFLGALPPDKPLTPLSLNDADRVDDVVLEDDLFDFLH